MMPLRRSKPTPWTLRPGDALPERVLTERPELRGIENNAAYRIMLHQQRVGLPMSPRQILVLGGFLLYSVYAILQSKLMRLSVSPFLILPLICVIFGIYGFSLYYSNKPARASQRLGLSYDLPVLLRLTPQNLADLHSALVSPHDILLALWALRLRVQTVRKRLAIRWIAAVIVVCGIAIMLLLPSPPQMAALPFVFCGFFLGFDLGQDRFRTLYHFNRIARVLGQVKSAQLESIKLPKMETSAPGCLMVLFFILLSILAGFAAFEFLLIALAIPMGMLAALPTKPNVESFDEAWRFATAGIETIIRDVQQRNDNKSIRSEQ